MPHKCELNGFAIRIFNVIYTAAATLLNCADAHTGPPAVEKIQPNFGLSGKLAAETNTFQGVVLKYNEPPEAKVAARALALAGLMPCS